jgi:hypothetical protein
VEIGSAGPAEGCPSPGTSGLQEQLAAVLVLVLARLAGTLKVLLTLPSNAIDAATSLALSLLLLSDGS